MKKTIIALGLLCGAGGMAHAQSSVTIYGLVDAGVVHESGSAAGSITKLTGSVGSGSRLGFRGVEDLGGGLSAHFLLESGFQPDTGTLGQGGLLFGRQGFVGVKGNFGTFNFGRQYTPHFLTASFVDPFASGLAGTNTTIMAISGARMNNTVKYITPDLAGWSAELVYGFGESNGSVSENSAFGGFVSYVAGPFSARLAHHNKNTTTATRDTDAKNTLLAATYHFGVAKAFLGYGINKGQDSSPFLVANPYGAATAPAASTDSREYTIGVTVPVGSNSIMASYIRKDDKNPANRDADKFGIGYFHVLSKRTSLYVAYSQINNKNGAAYTVGSAIEAGSGDNATNLGVRHVF